MRIIVADDHSMMRDILRIYIADLAMETVVIEADSLQQVLAHREDKAPPGLILLDLGMPGMEGLEGVAAVRQAFPKSAIVIISAVTDPKTIRGALRLGINGYIPKTTGGKSLVTALKLVMDGETYLPPSLLEEVAEASVVQAQEPSMPFVPAAVNVFSKLSEREVMVLRLLIQGKANKEIALQLNLQEVTVKVHLRNIYRKIHATNRADAVRLAFQHGWS